MTANTILALDPGTTETGFCLYDGERVIDSGVSPNERVLAHILATTRPGDARILAIEMIASYGMAVGREVFETCVWIGRFQQAWHNPNIARLVYRRTVKLHLCASPNAKDPNIRQALLDKFARTGGGKTPQIGTKAQPGPLYGVTSHAWAALAVAVTVAETQPGSVPLPPARTASDAPRPATSPAAAPPSSRLPAAPASPASQLALPMP